MSTDDAIIAIRDVFRERGFEGTSLTHLSEATGLKRASLYHRFPDGKDGMAIAAIESAANFLEQEIFVSLAGTDPWHKRMQTMCEQLDAFYSGGRKLCLMAAFSFRSTPDSVQYKLHHLLLQWQDHLISLAIDAGHSRKNAGNIAEQILVEIQGSLIIAALMDDISPFQRALARLHKHISDT